MNANTAAVTVLTLWLIMGLGFMVKWLELRRQGRGLGAAVRTWEGLLFLASIGGAVLFLSFIL